jgi:hypothetical protein
MEQQGQPTEVPKIVITADEKDGTGGAAGVVEAPFWTIYGTKGALAAGLAVDRSALELSWHNMTVMSKRGGVSVRVRVCELSHCVSDCE